jgi:hypothetical protein
VEDVTAGQYKRTLTPYKKITPADKSKMKVRLPPPPHTYLPTAILLLLKAIVGVAVVSNYVYLVLQQDVEDIHGIFKDFVSQYRPQVNIAEVATGEVTIMKVLSCEFSVLTLDWLLLLWTGCCCGWMWCRFGWARWRSRKGCATS